MKTNGTSLRESIVLFRTAELAMNKGFNYPTCPLYRINDKELELPETPEEFAQYRNWNEYSDSVSAPTQSMLAKWLREERKINLWVMPAGLGYICYYTEVNSPEEAGRTSGNKYEEVLEKGLFEALKLIKAK
jgi:hypothetical protein